MRVLHVETGRHRYGGAQQVLYLIQGLIQRGVACALACERAAAIADPARQLGATVFEIPHAAGPKLIWRLPQLVRQHAIDIVHLHSRRGADDFGILGARLSGAKVVLSRRVDNRQPRALLAIKQHGIDHTIAISRAIRRVLLHDGMDRHRLSCVPSAIDLSKTHTEGDPNFIRRYFNVPEETRIIAMAAQFIERKGHHTLIQAMPRVVQAHPQTRVVLFGQGPLRASVEAAVHRLGLDDYVVFAGFEADLTPFWPGVDVLAHPAYREGLGIALLEAAAAGVPIVAGRAGGIPEIVRDGETGRLIEPGDHHALAEALIALLNDPNRRAALAAQGRQRVAERFSIDAMVAGNLTVYRKLLGIEGRVVRQ
jgi:glycosyltransferase involved in cell wall biosynthesis